MPARLCIFALLVVAGCGGPKYADILQEYKTELELFDRLTEQRKKHREEHSATVREVTTLLLELPESTGKAQQRARLNAMEEEFTKELAEFDTTIEKQLERVNKVKERLKAAEKSR